jgi:REP element-mobilizing transposase RayT
MGQSLAAMYCHVIFSTKNREPYLTPELQPRLYAYLGGILQPQKSVLLAAGGIADHVHLLISLGRELAIADAVRLLKANSSGWIHDTFPDRQVFAWQVGYGAFSVSYSNLKVVKRYIANQEKHHRRRTFQEEYREFLVKHDVEFDERYVWD